METTTPEQPPSLPAPIPDLIQRYLNGESIQTLAQEHRTARQTIYNWMLAETQEQYEQLVTTGLVNRIADADGELDEAATAIDIARAREKCRYSRMDFERRRPKLYGPQAHVQVDQAITVIVNREKAAQPIDITASPASTIGAETQNEEKS